MKTAIITGSFDPITTGHVDLIRRASKIFDKVVVTVLSNAEKNGMFTPDERFELVEAAIADFDGVSTLLWDGLTSGAAHKVDAKFIVRGARSASDFDYEYDLSGIMKRFDSELETVIIPASPELSMISSTYVRELIKYGCPLEGSIPDECIPLIKKMIEEKSK